MKKGSIYLLVLAWIPFFLLITACSDTNNDNGNNKNDTNNNETTSQSDNNNNDSTEETKADITIRWGHQWGEDHFNEHIRDKVEDEFPHITFDVVDAGTDHPDEGLEDLVAAKKSPDVVGVGTIEHLFQLENLGLDYNMDDLIEETDFDLDAIEPALIENARNQSPHNDDGLYAIPYQRATWALHYDTDVFDKLGVEYPEDGMTWEEVLELGKQLTQEVDGVQYRGIDLDGWYASYLQFDDNPIDPDTDEVLIDQSEPVKRFLQYIDDVVSIPGNYPDHEPSSMLHHWGELLGEANIAMYPERTTWNYIEDNDNINIATYPVWEGHEGVDPLPHGSAWAITEPSEHKEEALEVIEYLLSEDVQIENSKDGEPSVLKNPDIHAVFGENRPELVDKNLEALFKNTPATGPEQQSKYSDGVIWRAGVEFVDSGKDINEFIRIIQEEVEENVRSQKASE